MKHTFSLLMFSLLLATPEALAKTWVCTGDNHVMNVDYVAKTAQLTDMTMDDGDFDLSPSDFRYTSWTSGEQRLEFAVVGPEGWADRRRGSEKSGWITLYFDRVQDRYEATIRLRDTHGGGLQLLPYLSFDCEI